MYTVDFDFFACEVDWVTGQPFEAGRLEPGNSREFYIDTIQLGAKLMMAVVVDKIGRRYQSEGGVFEKALFEKVLSERQ